MKVKTIIKKGDYYMCIDDLIKSMEDLSKQPECQSDRMLSDIATGITIFIKKIKQDAIKENT